MERDLMLIMERLVADFGERVPRATMLVVLRDCAEKYADGPPEIVEQATRIQLQIRNQGHSQ